MEVSLIIGAIISIIVALIPVIGELRKFVEKRSREKNSIPASTTDNNQNLSSTKDQMHNLESAELPIDSSMKSRNNIDVSSGYIFISYRRSDSADIAGRIYDRLIGKFGRNPVFKDVDSIPLGLDFKDYLGKQVGECNVLLAIIGDRWLDTRDSSGDRRLDDPSDFVRIEIESALERGIPVIPLLVREAKMPREESLPPSLRRLVYRNGTPIRSDPDFHRDMDRLIKALEEYVK